MAPMMPMDAASGCVKPSSRATINVRKMPNCPAAPSSTRRGFSSRGPKSVSAPMPVKISSGNSSLPMPRHSSTKTTPIITTDCGVTLATPCISKARVSGPSMVQPSAKRTMGSPWPTAWPAATQTSAIVPARGAPMRLCIFMASGTATCWPRVTTSPANDTG